MFALTSVATVWLLLVGQNALQTPSPALRTPLPTEEEEIVPCPLLTPDPHDRQLADPYLAIAAEFNGQWLRLDFPDVPEASASALTDPSSLPAPSSPTIDPSPELAKLAALRHALVTSRAQLEALDLSAAADPPRDRLRSELAGALRIVDSIEDAPNVLDLEFLVPLTMARTDGTGPIAAASCVRERLGLPPPGDDDVL